MAQPLKKEPLDLTYKGQPVIDLLPAVQDKKVIGPDDDVILINRGRAVITDMYNGIIYEIPPRQLCKAKYGAAMHFQSRQVVPGTRNPLVTGTTQKQQSFIGIMDVDSEERCRVFTDEEVARYGLVSEAIDRSVLDPGDQAVTKVSTNAVAASLPGAGAGGGRRPQISGDTEALAEVPVSENAAVQEIAQSSRESAMDKAAQATRNRKAARDAEE